MIGTTSVKPSGQTE
jgi:hypothetical protein